MRRSLALALLGAQAASGYIYKLSHNTGSSVASGDGTYAQSALVLSEGPMFASHKAPFGGGPSSIKLGYTASVVPSTEAGLSESVNIHMVFLDPNNKGTAGVRYEDDTAEYCCTQTLKDEGECGEGVELGGFIITDDSPTKPKVVTSSLSTTAGSSVKTEDGTEVNVEGTQYIIVAACDSKGDADAVLPDVALDITVEFKNPYGYLPGQLYGYLPFYGVLFVAYLLFTLGYSISACVQRQYLLKLQLMILAVVGFGMLEMAVWFFMYQSKNETGVPTPCNVCPTTHDYLAAVVMNVLKRASSRVMLLVVALGYGVVHITLPRRTTLAVAALGVVYAFVSVLDSINRQTSYDIGPSTWEIPVLLTDFLFVGWIYVGMTRIKKGLVDSNQHAKLGMYGSLTYVIIFNIAGWFLTTLIMVGIRMGGLPLPWKSLFIFANFWDLNYLLVLIAVAWIWRPGPNSHQYVYSAQLPTTEQDAEAGPDSADFADVPAPGNFSIQNDEDDDDEDASPKGATVATSGGAGAKARAASDEESGKA